MSSAYFCHECQTKVIDCNEKGCQLCDFSPSFCHTCKSHVAIFDVK